MRVRRSAVMVCLKYVCDISVMRLWRWRVCVSTIVVAILFYTHKKQSAKNEQKNKKTNTVIGLCGLSSAVHAQQAYQNFFPTHNKNSANK